MATIEELGARVDDLARRVDAAESVLAVQRPEGPLRRAWSTPASTGAAVVDRRPAGRAGRMPPPSCSPRTASGTVGPARAWPGAGWRSPPGWPSPRWSSPATSSSSPGSRSPGTGRRRGGTCCARAPGPTGTSLWMSGYEDDTYARVDGVWLHATMTLTTVFVSPAGEGWPTHPGLNAGRTPRPDGAGVRRPGGRWGRPRRGVRRGVRPPGSPTTCGRHRTGRSTGGGSHRRDGGARGPCSGRCESVTGVLSTPVMTSPWTSPAPAPGEPWRVPSTTAPGRRTL